MISLSEREHRWFHDFCDSVFVFNFLYPAITYIHQQEWKYNHVQGNHSRINLPSPSEKNTGPCKSKTIKINYNDIPLECLMK